MNSERLREFHEHVNFRGFAGPESSITTFAYANGRERSSLHDPQVSLGHDRSLAYLAWIGCPVQINRPSPVPARPLRVDAYRPAPPLFTGLLLYSATLKSPTSYPLRRLTRTSPRIGQTSSQTVSPDHNANTRSSW